MLAPSPISSATSGVRLRWPDGHAEGAKLRPIGKSGGAGEVFAIDGKPGLLAKIYHAGIRETQLAHYARKLEWMIGHKPALPTIPPEYQGVVQLAWPVALVTRKSGFAGFVMEKIDFERTMELDYLLSHRQAAAEGFDADLGKLVTVCYNLASLIDCLHASGIAVVDLKPINLKVYKSELYVSILDCDGFHIDADGFVSEAPQVTPEYLAPEFHGRLVARPQAQDRFALATIIFRLLNFGIHPYTGVAAHRQAYPAELAGRIERGLYPYGRVPACAVRAAPASVHDCLPDAIRDLFDRSFTPHTDRRASARDWIDVLGAFASKGSGRMSRCDNGHLQFAGMSCPTCRRNGILRLHLQRRDRWLTRIQASPARAVTYVRQSLRGTRTSPFQAALAQMPANPLQLAPPQASIRNVLSVEIVWAIGLLITYWWLR